MSSMFVLSLPKSDLAWLCQASRQHTQELLSGRKPAPRIEANLAALCGLSIAALRRRRHLHTHSPARKLVGLERYRFVRWARARLRARDLPGKCVWLLDHGVEHGSSRWQATLATRFPSILQQARAMRRATILMDWRGRLTLLGCYGLPVTSLQTDLVSYRPNHGGPQ